MSDQSHSYEGDLEVFRRLSRELDSEHHGKYILVKNGENQGIFSSFEDAHREALEKFGTDDVVIGQIGVEPPLNFIAVMM